jgi:hypothetical protein
METALGLLGIVVWILVVVLVASAVTYVVVRVSPGDRAGDSPDARSEG